MTTCGSLLVNGEDRRHGRYIRPFWSDVHERQPCETKHQASHPGRSSRRVKTERDRTLYKQRDRIERMFGHLKISRAIATRYDQLPSSFLGMVQFATAKYWLKFVHAA